MHDDRVLFLFIFASGSTKAFSADSTTALTAAFTAIGDDISQLRLSK